jgi:hypothetical protein
MKRHPHALSRIHDAGPDQVGELSNLGIKAKVYVILIDQSANHDRAVHASVGRDLLGRRLECRRSMASDNQCDVADVLPQRAGESLCWLARMGLSASQLGADTGIAEVTAYMPDVDGTTLYDVVRDAAQGQRLCTGYGDQGGECELAFYHMRSGYPRGSKGDLGAAQIESEPRWVEKE